MSLKPVCSLLVFGLVCLPVSLAAKDGYDLPTVPPGQENLKLHVDPFKQPQISQYSASSDGSQISGNSRKGWSVELRGTMQSARLPMVNLDGEVIALGEQVDGFRLVEVGERSAVFIKGSKRYVLSMD